jgi:hypothetical protein
MSNASLYGWLGLALFATFIALLICVEVVLWKMRRTLQLRPSMESRFTEPVNWWGRVQAYQLLRTSEQAEIAQKARLLRFFYRSSQIAMALLLIVFVLGNLTKG